MQEIADAVGMTKPALYYHFKDKQDLLLAVIAREMTVALTCVPGNPHRRPDSASASSAAQSGPFPVSRATSAA